MATTRMRTDYENNPLMHLSCAHPCLSATTLNLIVVRHSDIQFGAVDWRHQLIKTSLLQAEKMVRIKRLDFVLACSASSLDCLHDAEAGLLDLLNLGLEECLGIYAFLVLASNGSGELVSRHGLE